MSTKELNKKPEPKYWKNYSSSIRRRKALVKEENEIDKQLNYFKDWKWSPLLAYTQMYRDLNGVACLLLRALIVFKYLLDVVVIINNYLNHSFVSFELEKKGHLQS